MRPGLTIRSIFIQWGSVLHRIGRQQQREGSWLISGCQATTEDRLRRTNTKAETPPLLYDIVEAEVDVSSVVGMNATERVDVCDSMAHGDQCAAVALTGHPITLAEQADGAAVSPESSNVHAPSCDEDRGIASLTAIPAEANETTDTSVAGSPHPTNGAVPNSLLTSREDLPGAHEATAPQVGAHADTSSEAIGASSEDAKSDAHLSSTITFTKGTEGDMKRRPPVERVRSACKACNERKLRCRVTDGSGRCNNCIARNIPCEARIERKRGRPRASYQMHPGMGTMAVPMMQAQSLGAISPWATWHHGNPSMAWSPPQTLDHSTAQQMMVAAQSHLYGYPPAGMAHNIGPSAYGAYAASAYTAAGNPYGCMHSMPGATVSPDVLQQTVQLGAVPATMQPTVPMSMYGAGMHGAPHDAQRSVVQLDASQRGAPQVIPAHAQQLDLSRLGAPRGAHGEVSSAQLPLLPQQLQGPQQLQPDGALQTLQPVNAPQMPLVAAQRQDHDVSQHPGIVYPASTHIGAIDPGGLPADALQWRIAVSQPGP